MPHWYATLAQVKNNINTEKESKNVPLLDYAAAVSERIDSEIGRDLPFFLPYYVEDEPVSVTPGSVNSRTNTLALRGYWLELNTVSLNGRVLGMDTDVFPEPPGGAPIHSLRLGRLCDNWYGGDVALTGVQGYRRRGGKRWLKVGTLAADITADATTITVNNLATPPALISGENNRDFSAGCLFRIDSEYCFKLFSNAGTEVERGVNGTTAAAHGAGTVIEVFQVEANIARIVSRQAGLWLARRGAYDTRGSNDVGTPIVYPGDLLAELWGVLQGYAYL